MLCRIGWRDLGGTYFTWIMNSEMMTAMKERPFREKHQVAPTTVYATPPMIGPRMRARLNWIEFMAIAFGEVFRPHQGGQ